MHFLFKRATFNLIHIEPPIPEFLKFQCYPLTSCPNMNGRLIIIFEKNFPSSTFIRLHKWNKYPTQTFISSYPLITYQRPQSIHIFTTVLNTSYCCFFGKPHNLSNKLVLLVQAVTYIHRSSCKGGSSSNSSKFSSHSRYFFRQNVTLCDHCDQGRYQSLLRRIV